MVLLVLLLFRAVYAMIIVALYLIAGVIYVAVWLTGMVFLVGKTIVENSRDRK